MTSLRITNNKRQKLRKSNDKRAKILYIHGLESGPHGRKVRHLSREFNVLSPDMKMAKFKLLKENSFIRCFIRQQMIPLAIMIGLLLVATKGILMIIFYISRNDIIYFVI